MCFRFIDVACLQELMAGCDCGGALSYNEDRMLGAVSSGQAFCKACKKTSSISFAPRLQDRSFDLNVRLVTACRASGIGLAQLKVVLGLLDIPATFSATAYGLLLDKVCEATCEVGEDSMNEAAREVHVLKGVNEDDVCDCTVMCDGTWHKRGHSSLHGVVTAISMDTGKVVDVECKSKVCKGCERMSKLDAMSDEYKKWHEQHKCARNFSGSAPSMEPAGVSAMFHRSVNARRLRYTGLIGDGDSKSYKRVCDEQVYGEDCEVVKKECVGHVQKRMGTALRNLKKDCGKRQLSDGKTIGGKGRLTDKKIDLIQTYYGLAIRRNVGDLQGMTDSVNAILDHMSSTDDSPRYSLCPTGVQSWCGYNRGIATGQTHYSHKDPLPPAVVTELRPVFTRLSRTDLVIRCLDGYTQNACESFNATVWARCPKEKFAGGKAVKLAVYDAVCNFNNGKMSAVRVLNKLGVCLGANGQKLLKSLDERRVRAAARRISEVEKKKREVKRRSRKDEEERQIDEEGTSYASGAF